MSSDKDFFVCSDHHFGHANILSYCRPEFQDIEEMHDHIITKHNSVVGPNDKCYFLGDVAFGRDNLGFLASMHGHKYLVMGNHDDLSIYEYMKYFKKIRGVKEYRINSDCCVVLSHMPISTAQLGKRYALNVHGHMHASVVTKAGLIHGEEAIDYRYKCVSLEQIDYTPIRMSEIINAYI